MSKKLLSKTLRVITIAPFMALILLSLIYIQHPEYLGGLSAYILAVLFLVVFPVLAYPLQPFIPKFRGRGRGSAKSGNGYGGHRVLPGNYNRHRYKSRL